MRGFDMRIVAFVALVLFCFPLSFAAAAKGETSVQTTQSEHGEAPPAPFGSDLFQGNFAKGTFDELNADYKIMPGDRIAVRFWGARTFESVLEVDARGNLFLPEVGPVPVSGIKHSDLGELIQTKVKSVYKKNVEVYTNLLNAQPVAVFVTGFVGKPGRYAGGATDSILYYIDLAGGIDAERGSYRDIRLIRNGEVMERIDLYPFILEGVLPRPRLEDGDLILVDERGAGVLATGQVRHNARFEFPPDAEINGQQLATLASLQNRASHASIVGTHNKAPFNSYLPLIDFFKISLEDGDTVEFLADTPGDTIMVAASGAIIGASRYPVHKSTRLLELLDSIPLEPELANLDGIHIKRRSTAIAQKRALNEALNRLEHSSLNATSSGGEEANIRVREAELISQFVNKARNIQPDGTVVVGHNGVLSDIYLEDGDVIVIPSKSDVVLISGEVLMPKALVYYGEKDVDDYIDNAGGFSTRADKRHILVAKPNGEVFMSGETDIAAGDQILVLPLIDTKNMQVAKDITQILYQIAIATSVAIGL
jgi:protein involved in polysaccharide export with SLBB domain